MIVQPNFIDHHKTRQFVIELGGDELAPLYVLRLWAHCQNQKKWRFPKMSAQALAAVTCAKTSPELLWLAMQNAGYIRVIRDVLVVHQWEEYNQSLVKNWENGKKGGRPQKPNGNPKSVRVNPNKTQTSFGVTDRLDREDKSVVCVSPPAAAPTTTPPHDIRLVENHHEEIAARWPKHDVMQCYRRAQRYVKGRRGNDAVVTVGWFENSWMPGEAEAKRTASQQTPSQPVSEPPSSAEIEAERARWLALPEPEEGTLDHAMWQEARSA